MRVKTDENFIKRKARLGKFCSLGGLVVLTIGMVINFSNPNLFELSLLCLVAGFGIASVGSYNVSRWVKPPRGDEVLEKALKGLSNKYGLYNYVLPAPHSLLTPFGLYVLLTKKQNGEISYKTGDKWRQKSDVKRRLRVFFGGEQSVGNPSSELASEISNMRKMLTRLLPDEELEVSRAIVFLHDDARLEIESSEVPVLKPKDLKKFLADEQKKRQNWPADRLGKVAAALDGRTGG